ncbi:MULTISPECIES: UbiX family flavin prenyltransferase [Metallosphaera]|uniref:Flavin prenyltransferase UbiX n=3 Tax=Metallosphaera TaxID=41980 RepID=A4YIV5_METS5|nr:MULTISPECIES: UbiX family flavin prenyltransferase [Metallosphaera]ABP96357.1 3-octaprenyl-4-hydroxybenzoate carboxy-lyase [Metallosphaera sedula DSM 5348]AIM28340.1 3-octaprenyl-4-hydroxybenzoate carboxy-lyase [Metallosphaera sedula]AKV75138.1 aromatic acid decarboxylase [Metallosphaera sedula]AKV77376.1 aromatic acid decarboxylase [Metallosphaera sedula]AKV79627.1 aromatic acid decarboxylase [Metallosphaera sedula]
MDERLAKETGADKAKRKVVVGVTGASGVIYGISMIKILVSLGLEPVVIVSKGALKVAKAEQGIDLIGAVRDIAKEVYLENEMDAPPSSSSALVKTLGMAIIPCSIRTLAQIAAGISSNLVSRTAINMLRLKKRLVLVVRETPLGTIELENALKVSVAGGIILPASPGFYTKPKTIEDMINFVVGKTLDALEIEHDIYRRWTR